MAAVVQISQHDAYRIMFKDYPDVLNIDEMCDILGISIKTGYQLLKNGKIQNLKVGRTGFRRFIF